MKEAMRNIVAGLVVLAFVGVTGLFVATCNDSGQARSAEREAPAEPKKLRAIDLDNPIPPGQKLPPPRKPIQGEHVANVRGITVNFVTVDGEPVFSTRIPMLNLKRNHPENRWKSEADMEAKVLENLRNAVTFAGVMKGKSPEWVQSNRDALHFVDHPELMSMQPELSRPICAPQFDALSSAPVVGPAPECGGGGGGTCGECVCLSLIQTGNGWACGGGCGTCYWCTVCG